MPGLSKVTHQPARQSSSGRSQHVVYGTVERERKTEQVAGQQEEEHQMTSIRASAALRTTTKLKSILKQANSSGSTAAKPVPGAYWSASSDSATREEPSEVDIVRAPAQPDKAGRHFRDGPARNRGEEQVKLEASQLGAPEGATEARRRSFVRFSEINSVLEPS